MAGWTSQPRNGPVFAARDRCGDAIDRVRSVRTDRFLYIRNFEPDRPYTQHSGYKKLQYPVLTLLPVLAERGELSPIARRFLAERKPVEELYDVVADPFQTKNVASSPKCAEPLEVLRKRLDEWMQATDDQGRFAEGNDEYTAGLLAEKRANYNRAMQRRGLDPELSDAEYLRWWEMELGVAVEERR